MNNDEPTETRWRRIPAAPIYAIPLYRFSELKSVDPHRRDEIVREAMRLAHGEPAVIALCAATLTLVVLLALASPTWLDGGVAVAIFFALLAPFHLFLHFRARRHVRQLLGTIPTSR